MRTINGLLVLFTLTLACDVYIDQERGVDKVGCGTKDIPCRSFEWIKSVPSGNAVLCIEKGEYLLSKDYNLPFSTVKSTSNEVLFSCNREDLNQSSYVQQAPVIIGDIISHGNLNPLLFENVIFRRGHINLLDFCNFHFSRVTLQSVDLIVSPSLLYRPVISHILKLILFRLEDPSIPTTAGAQRPFSSKIAI
jgi:hypothetical protein